MAAQIPRRSRPSTKRCWRGALFKVVEKLTVKGVSARKGKNRTPASTLRGTSYKRITECAANETGEKAGIRLTTRGEKAL
jgi:hypothetical protein